MGQVCQLAESGATVISAVKPPGFQEDEILPPFLDTFWRRLNLFRRGMNDRQFAKELGVSPSTFSGWKRGRVPQSLETYEHLAARLYGICPIWLAIGLGSKSMPLLDGERATLIPGRSYFIHWHEEVDGSVRHSWQGWGLADDATQEGGAA